MKKASINLIQSLILVIGVAGCDKSDDELSTAELLVGTWTTSAINVDAKVGSKSLVDYLIDDVGLSPEEAAAKYALFEAGLESELTGSLTLHSDQTYESAFGSGSDSGTWSLSADEKTLTLYEGSDTIVITVNSVSGSTLNVTLGNDISQDLDDDMATPDETITAVADLTLTK